MRIAECACGQLKARCDGEPTKVSLCHCASCQRRTGSTYGLAAFFPREKVTVEGAAKTFVRRSESGYDVSFRFCADCGSTVCWEPARMPTVIAVAVGAFSDPSFPAPTKAVHAEMQHPWVDLACLDFGS